MTRTISFYVVDDHPVFRQGLVALIKSNAKYEVSGQAGDIDEALELFRERTPDIALIDISLGHKNGLDLVRTIKSTHPQVTILIISMHDEAVYAARALKAGARGYVMKEEASSVMLEAIRTVLSGRIYVSEAMRDRLLETLVTPDADPEVLPTARLSDRELEVLELIGQGYGASEIGTLLHLSVKTVNVYRDHLKEKMKIPTAAELRRFAVKWIKSRDI